MTMNTNTNTNIERKEFAEFAMSNYKRSLFSRFAEFKKQILKF